MRCDREGSGELGYNASIFSDLTGLEGKEQKTCPKQPI